MWARSSPTGGFPRAELSRVTRGRIRVPQPRRTSRSFATSADENDASTRHVHERVLAERVEEQERRIVKRQKNITYVGLASNLGLGAGKCVLGVMSGSASLLADGLHSVSDGTSDVVALAVVSVARRKPTKTQPYGWGAYESVGSLGVGGLVFAGGVGAGAHSLSHLSPLLSSTPEALEPLTLVPLTLGIATLSIVVKEYLYQATKKIGKETRSPVLIANAYHHRSDALSSVVAVAGLAGSALGMVYLDPLAGLVVSGMVMKQGYDILKDGVSDITQRNTATHQRIADKIKVLAEEMVANHEIRGVREIRARRMGSYRFIDLRMIMDSKTSLTSSYRAGRKLRRSVMKLGHGISDVFVHIDGGDLEYIDDQVSVSMSHVEVEEAFRREVEIEFENEDSPVVEVASVRVHYVNKSPYSFSMHGDVKVLKTVVEASMVLRPELTLREAQIAGRRIKRRIVKDVPTVIDCDLNVQLYV